nr:MAG TPA: hypothetical protein [Caudoviricetes sp.]
MIFLFFSQSVRINPRAALVFSTIAVLFFTEI